MREVGKIVGINIAILIAYTIILGATDLMTGGNQGYFLFGLMILPVIHAAIDFVLAIVYLVIGRQERGLGFLLSVLVVPLIGFSTCLGGADFFQFRI
jgi:hypothetical protein